jgi:hypothetical protein
VSVNVFACHQNLFERTPVCDKRSVLETPTSGGGLYIFALKPPDVSGASLDVEIVAIEKTFCLLDCLLVIVAKQGFKT